MRTHTTWIWAATSAAVAGLTACEKPSDSATSTPKPQTAAPTPMDQGESESDRRISADIRKAVLAQEGLSVNAQNCKIICRDGVVTLRGVVASESESQVIQAKAASVPGVTSVSNQLEVRVQ